VTKRKQGETTTSWGLVSQADTHQSRFTPSLTRKPTWLIRPSLGTPIDPIVRPRAS
jgi:hypothetical protein